MKVLGLITSLYLFTLFRAGEFVDFPELKNIIVTEDDLKSDIHYAESIKLEESIKIEETEIACILLVKEYMNSNKPELTDIIRASNYLEEDTFDSIFIELLNNCKQKLNKDNLDYILNYEDHGRILNEKTSHLISFDKNKYTLDSEQNTVLRKRYDFKDQDKDTLSYLEMKINLEEKTQPTKSNTKEDNKTISSTYLIAAFSILIFILVVIRNINKKNEVHQPKSNPSTNNKKKKNK